MVGSKAEQHEGERYPHLIQSSGLGHDGGEERECGERAGVDQGSEQHRHE